MAFDVYYNRLSALLGRIQTRLFPGYIRILRSIALALGLGLCITTALTGFAAGTVGAMPATEEEDGRPKPIRSGSTFDTPFKPSVTGQLTNPYDDLFRNLDPLDKNFHRLDSSGARIELTRDEKAALGTLLSTPDDTSYENSLGPTLSYHSANRSEREVLIKQFETDIDALYDDLQVNAQVGSPMILPQAGTPFNGIQSGPRTLRIVSSRKTDDLPLLSAIPLGSVFLDSVKSIVNNAGHSAESLASLRDFVFVQEPDNGSIMMVDNGTGYTVMLHSSDKRILSSAPDNGSNSVLEKENATVPVMTSSFDRGPLHLRILDFLTSTGALVVYVFFLICWAAWRYVISRYV